MAQPSTSNIIQSLEQRLHLSPSSRLTLGQAYAVIHESDTISIVNLGTQALYALRFKITADSVILSPSSSTLAVISDQNVNVFTVDHSLIRLSETNNIDISFPILFWRFLDSNTIVFASAKAVYEWSLNDNTQPRKLFDIAPNEDVKIDQVFQFERSMNRSWYLVHLKSGNQHILLLFDAHGNKVATKMNAACGCFVDQSKSTLLCYIIKKPWIGSESSDLFILELEIDVDDPVCLRESIENLGVGRWDLISVSEYGIVYLQNRMSGGLWVFDVRTGGCLGNVAGSHYGHGYIAMQRDERNSGVLRVRSSGQIECVHVKQQSICPYCSKVFTSNTLPSHMMQCTFMMQVRLSGELDDDDDDDDEDDEDDLYVHVIEHMLQK
eukprot:40818_1